MLREIAVALKNWHIVKEALDTPYNEEYDNFLCELLRLQKNCMCKISEDYSRVIVSYRGSTYAFLYVCTMACIAWRYLPILQIRRK